MKIRARRVASNQLQIPFGRLLIAVVVPAYNEAAVLAESLKSLSTVVSSDHIYVVSDGSTDQTARIAKASVPNVLALKKNRGKAGALKALITKFRLTRRYDYIFFFDADTRISREFLKRVRRMLVDEKPALLVGTVGSGRNGLISAYRAYEYGFSHFFYKNAQNAMGTIVVAPGCASVYRSDVIDALDFTNHTLTEDLDLTMQIHHRRLGRIVYCPQATVATQDPATFSDYWKQINRWNTGFWQNFFLHKLYQPNRKINLEVLLLVADVGLWLVILALAAVHPLVILKLYGLSLLISTSLGVATVALTGQFWALPYAPLFGFFHLINLSSLIYSLFRATVRGRQPLSWQKVSRYALSQS
ncbi:MAG TPA: glycosyltransferase family 2 protein [Candidatus Saccharimonadales bacterium]|nr:glycosyltransferase family 2 protein [Candidatus Saccharimonadales bacterium]